MATKKIVNGGICVTFDGIDGVGKTTQIELAEKALQDQGYSVHRAKGLGGTPIGEELRAVLFKPIYRPPLTNFYIGIAALEAAAEDNEKALKRGEVVLLDRGPISLVAYQSFGEGVDAELAWYHADRGMEKYHIDLTICYDLDLMTAKDRLRASRTKSDYFENQPEDFFIRVQKAIDEGSKRYEAKTIDAHPSIEEVHKSTMALIEAVIVAKTSAA